MNAGEELEARARRIIETAIDRGATIATAESCTGGLIAAALTAIPGSSAVFDRGFVTYSNAAKSEMLGVDAGLIAEFGAVSEPVAHAMVEGALARSRATLGVSVTGVAGPGGGSAEKPVGLVHLAAACGPRILHREMRYGDVGRGAIRRLSVATAFDLIETLLGELPQGAP